MGLFSKNKNHFDAQTRRGNKNLQWDALVEQLEARFEKEAERRSAMRYFENVYVARDDTYRFIEFRLGQHPIGPAVGKTGSAVESGAKLLIAQDAKGGVGVILFPYQSERIKRNEERIVWGLYKSPRSLKPWHVEIAVSDLFRYVDVSSAMREADWFARMRVDWLLFRDRLRSAAVKHTQVTRLLKAGAFAVGFIGFLSALATLAGTSVPQVWAQYHMHTPVEISKEEQPQTASKTGTASSLVLPVGSKAMGTLTPGPAPIPAMPVITGWYTFCPSTSPKESNPKLLDFLYDVRQHAGKVAFFDVQIDIDCVMGVKPGDGGPLVPVERTAEKDAVEYAYRVTFDPNDSSSARKWLDGARDPLKLPDLYADNGSFIDVHGDSDSRNAFTRLNINSEGVDDVIYGPYQIKASGEDAMMSLDLSAPYLDSPMQTAAAAAAAQLRTASEKAAAARQPNDVIVIQAEQESSSLPPVPNRPRLPPLTEKTLRRLPPLPMNAGTGAQHDRPAAISATSTRTPYGATQ